MYMYIYRSGTILTTLHLYSTYVFNNIHDGLNEELGRHRGREGKVECTLCGAECESVVHVLWECPTYSNCRLTFLKKLQELLGDTLIRLII